MEPAFLNTLFSILILSTRIVTLSSVLFSLVSCSMSHRTSIQREREQNLGLWRALNLGLQDQGQIYQLWKMRPLQYLSVRVSSNTRTLKWISSMNIVSLSLMERHRQSMTANLMAELFPGFATCENGLTEEQLMEEKLLICTSVRTLAKGIPKLFNIFEEVSVGSWMGWTRCYPIPCIPGESNHRPVTNS